MKYHEVVSEKVLSDMTLGIIPKTVLHWLTRAVHKEKYKKIIKLQRIIKNDENISASQALIKAASTYGINPREIIAVMDKSRRHK